MTSLTDKKKIRRLEDKIEDQEIEIGELLDELQDYRDNE